MFYGRKPELAFLKERYETEKAQLIVLYGRRRVGKTELLRFFSEDKNHIFYASRECTDKEQINLFSRKLLGDSPMKEYIKSFTDWEQAFRFIKDIHTTGKKLVIIDEFPYMVQGNRSIPSILQNLWDETLKNENVMVVLCGSSMSFIEKELLAEKNPLYGRTTGIYKLQELDFITASSFFTNKSSEEKVLLYSIFGGIPHYLNQYDDSLSIEENVKRNILHKGSVLYSEVEFMMKQELRETAIYNTLLEAIALGNTKLNDIYTKTAIEKTKISVYLKNLLDLNIIEREYSISTPVKKKASNSAGLYKIKDKFFGFYFRFLFPYMSELETGDIQGIYTHIVEPQLNEYTSFIFEDIAIQHMRRRKQQEKLPFYFTKIGRYWDKQCEIDLVATDQLGNAIYGECKWKKDKIGITELNRLREKAASVEGAYGNKYYYLFSKSGFDDALQKQSEFDPSIKLIGLEEICE